MLVQTPQGLYCPEGGFHIDPSSGVDTALITHAHSDHARRGSRRYLTASSGAGLLRARLGEKIALEPIEYGEELRFGPVRVSFHPAGHILGSAQIRLRRAEETWVVSGDYKRERDPSCEPFEPLKCDVFVTEATFGTPRFRWPRTDIGQEIAEWWRENASRGENSVVYAYSLGKTQRILALLLRHAEQPIFCHTEALRLIQCYRDQGIALAPTRDLAELPASAIGELILAPSSFSAPGPMFRTAFASGWMADRYQNRYDHGFVLSDHADWDDLLKTIAETGARRVVVQHRGMGALIRHLRSIGIEAEPVSALVPGIESSQLALF